MLRLALQPRLDLWQAVEDQHHALILPRGGRLDGPDARLVAASGGLYSVSEIVDRNASIMEAPIITSATYPIPDLAPRFAVKTIAAAMMSAGSIERATASLMVIVLDVRARLIECWPFLLSTAAVTYAIGIATVGT